jgi:hypothetical protein
MQDGFTRPVLNVHQELAFWVANSIVKSVGYQGLQYLSMEFLTIILFFSLVFNFHGVLQR